MWRLGLLVLGMLVLGLAVPAHAGPCGPEADGDRDDCRFQPRQVRPVQVELPRNELENKDSTVPYGVARAITYPLPIYANPVDYYASYPPAREFPLGNLWVSLVDSTEYNGERWYRINHDEDTNQDEYIRGDLLALGRPSRFQGVLLPQQPGAPFAFMLTWAQPSITPNGEPNAAVEALTRYSVVTIFETRTFDGVSWYRVGDDQWLPQTAVGVVTVDLRPEGVGPGERWIEVDLFEQTLAAYEGDRMVYATLVSSGTKNHATDPGLFRIWAKLDKAKMSGDDGKPIYYFLEDVPWTMYFNGDTALHGAYWHDAFGYRQSHGCVNLAPLDAQWLFNWTTPAWREGAKVVYPTDAVPGTWVWVH